MRTQSGALTQAWGAESVVGRYVIAIEFDRNDVVYFSSHDIPGLLVSYPASIHGINSTSQKLNPEKATATIGNISFSVIDADITELIRQKLKQDKGLRRKRVRFYLGAEGLHWDDFALFQTQRIDGLKYDSGLYTIECSDVQREMRREIFDFKTTRLRSTIAPRAPRIAVTTTQGFERVYQPPSGPGLTDAPGQTVGYIKLPTGCIVRYTGIEGNEFTGCTWGVLDTKHLAGEGVEVSDDTTGENLPKIEEYVYLEMPAVMLIYALLTGFLYGYAGEKIPDHWSLGITGEYIRTSDFVYAGFDLWNPGNFEEGQYAVVRGEKKTDGKKYIEEQLCLRLSSFMPIYSTGELGFKRKVLVHSSSSYVIELNRGSIVSHTPLNHGYEDVINRIAINWNWDGKEYKNQRLLIDEKSIERYGLSDIKTLNFRTLHSSRHSYETLKNSFDSLRDSFAGPPWTMTLDLLPEFARLEVGDIVRVNLSHVPDFTADGTFDRNMEIQQISVDWVTGKVSIQVFGSSQPASPLPPAESGAALSSDYMAELRSRAKVNVDNIPGVLNQNGRRRLTRAYSFSGSPTQILDSVIYCDGDFYLDEDTRLQLGPNAMLVVDGFCYINGPVVAYGLPADEVGSNRAVTPRYIGNTEAGDGVILEMERVFRSVRRGGRDGAWQQELSAPHVNTSTIRTGNNRQVLSGRTMDAAPPLNLTVSDTGFLQGLSGDFSGTPGPNGGPAVALWGGEQIAYALGGRGGTGGGGLIILSRGGAIGPSGSITTSGGKGQPGQTASIPILHKNAKIQAGSGGGGSPGAFYWLMNGTDVNPPSLSPSNSVASFGCSDTPITQGHRGIVDRVKVNSVENDWYDSFFAPIGSALVGSYLGSQREFKGDWLVGAVYEPGPNTAAVNHRLQFLTGHIKESFDTGFADVPAAVILSESTNTPATPLGNLSTIEISVTPPSDQRYLYSLIEYRLKGSGTPFIAVLQPASPETLVTVPSDGSTYEFRAYPVSKSREVSRDFATAEIKTTDISIPANRDKALPLSKVTLSLEGGGTTFDGLDAHFTWSNENAEKQHFDFYRVQILFGATVKRTENIRSNSYTYSGQKNFEDGTSRSFTIRVVAVGLQGQTSANADLTVSNPAPGQPSGLSIVPSFNGIKINHDSFDDPDYLKTEIFLSESSTVSTSGAPFATITQPSYSIVDLKNDTTYYIRLAFWDSFGRGTVTGTFAVKTLLQLSGYEIWGGWDQVDIDFANMHMSDNAIPSTKIQSLVASKILTGTLAATTTISCLGIIEAIDGVTDVRMGPREIGAQTFVFSAMVMGGLRFGIENNGAFQFGNPDGGQGIRWTPANGLVVTGNITANALTANTVTTDNLVGGAVSSASGNSYTYGSIQTGNMGASTTIHTETFNHGRPNSIRVIIQISILYELGGELDLQSSQPSVVDRLQWQAYYKGALVGSGDFPSGSIYTYPSGNVNKTGIDSSSGAISFPVISTAPAGNSTVSIVITKTGGSRSRAAYFRSTVVFQGMKDLPV